MKGYGRKDIDRYLFRSLNPKISFGMASDRYAGRVGQIYTEDRYKGQITRRTHTVGGKAFVEEILPVESVKEYFEHFPVLEIDYTFYRLLLEKDGKPTQNFHVLEKYRGQMKEGDSVILKVPQIVMARKLRRGSGFAENEAYLDAGIFTEQFYKPALEIMGSMIKGFVFEKEYHPKKERIDIEELARSLDNFFKAVPQDSRYHIELRTEAYLAGPVFEVLEKHGVGVVLSHWTWLPPLDKQLERSGGRAFNADGQSLVRLLTPFRMSYEDSYAKAFPFDKPVEGMANPKMIDDTVEIIRRAVNMEKRIVVIVNNRAGGNGPSIAQQIAKEILL